MRVFSLHLQSSTQYEQLDNIVSFVGEDLSGSFGILADHARLLTCLQFGLARFKYNNHKEEYLALPGGVLYFVDNKLKIATRHYFRSEDYRQIITELDRKLLAEETDIAGIKETLHNLDEKVLRRLWELKRGGET
jgi:F-type H+-transporting ATPase subunit epsilon